MAKNSQIVTVSIVAILAILAVMGFTQGWFGFSTTGTGTEDDPVVVTSGQCEIAPTLSVSAVNALSKGTAVTVDSAVRINDQYFSTTPSTFAKGDVVEVLVNASDFLDKTLEPITMQCGINTLQAEVFATDSTTVEVKDGDTTLTDSATGGASNASAVALGGTDTLNVVLTGTDKESSGDLIVVVELGARANVSDITMSSDGVALAEINSIPEVYTKTLSDPEIGVFRIPAIQNAVEKEYKLTYSAESAKDISGAVYVTFYSEQAFVDTDGTFTSGIEDSDGTLKYEDTFDYDFYITA